MSVQGPVVRRVWAPHPQRQCGAMGDQNRGESRLGRAPERGDRLGVTSRTAPRRNAKAGPSKKRLGPIALAVAVGLLIGMAGGILATFLVMRGPDLPRQEVVIGRVTAVNSDRSAFGFATDEGDKTGFPVSETEGADAIQVGARLRLVVLYGDGYQILVKAAPVP